MWVRDQNVGTTRALLPRWLCDRPHTLSPFQLPRYVLSTQARSVLEVAEELSRLGELGAAGKLGADDLSGGTFTLSNIGSIGGTYTSPVLMLPQVRPIHPPCVVAS